MKRIDDGRIPGLLICVWLNALGCQTAAPATVDDALANLPCVATDEAAFSDLESCLQQKLDTGYAADLNLRDVELTLESDIEVTSGDKSRAPLQTARFAMTELRRHGSVLIHSLVESAPLGVEQIDWKVGEAWKTWSRMSSAERESARRFRMTGVPAVVEGPDATNTQVGSSWSAVVPLRPTTLYAELGRGCEDGPRLIRATADAYWFVWQPDGPSCTAPKTNLAATVTHVAAKDELVYPEYDRLFEDHRMESAVFFGAVDDDQPTDRSFALASRFSSQLVQAGFVPVQGGSASRYSRTIQGFTAIVDVFTPREFSGIGDYSRREVFFEAVRTHEVIIVNAHEMPAPSDFWAEPQLYRNAKAYQIFMYAGALDPSSYVDAVLAGKKGAANVDIVSNLESTPFEASPRITSAMLALLLGQAPIGTGASWREIISRMNEASGDEALFGISGARQNKYKP